MVSHLAEDNELWRKSVWAFSMLQKIPPILLKPRQLTTSFPLGWAFTRCLPYRLLGKSKNLSSLKSKNRWSKTSQTQRKAFLRLPQRAKVKTFLWSLIRQRMNQLNCRAEPRRVVSRLPESLLFKSCLLQSTITRTLLRRPKMKIAARASSSGKSLRQRTWNVVHGFEALIN